MKLRCALAGLLVIGASGTASAGIITPPTGWILDTEMAKFGMREPHFGGGQVQLTVEAYKPATPGCTLFVTRASAAIPAKLRDIAANIEVDELAQKQRREAGSRVESSSVKFDAAQKALDGSLRWRDDNLITSSRVVAVADATNVVAVRGECLASTEASAQAALAACEAALATLDPGVAVDQRVQLAIIPNPVEAYVAAVGGTPAGSAPAAPGSAAPPAAGSGSAPAAGSGSGSATAPSDGQPRMSDGSKIHAREVPPAEAKKSETDRRPIYVGAGLVLLALAFWWNRRRRERFDREDRGEPAEEDDDADDLHAAAADAKPATARAEATSKKARAEGGEPTAEVEAETKPGKKKLRVVDTDKASDAADKAKAVAKTDRASDAADKAKAVAKTDRATDAADKAKAVAKTPDKPEKTPDQPEKKPAAIDATTTVNEKPSGKRSDETAAKREPTQDDKAPKVAKSTEDEADQDKNEADK